MDSRSLDQGLGVNEARTSAEVRQGQTSQAGRGEVMSQRVRLDNLDNRGVKTGRRGGPEVTDSISQDMERKEEPWGRRRGTVEREHLPAAGELATWTTPGVEALHAKRLIPLPQDIPLGTSSR